MSGHAGAFRLISPPAGSFLAASDVRIEVRQADGTWLPLQGVCSATIALRPNGPIFATLDVLVEEIDLEPLDPAGVHLVRTFFPPRTWRQRIAAWWRDRSYAKATGE